MTWCSSDHHEPPVVVVVEKSPSSSSSAAALIANKSLSPLIRATCPSCGHKIQVEDQGGRNIQDLLGLPAGVKFDPTDQELLEHLDT